MTKTYFLAALDLTGRACLVVGGGDEAADRTARLLEAGGRVTVISPTVTEQIRRWAVEGRIQHEPRLLTVDAADDAVAGFAFVFNTVQSDPALSRRIHECCEARRILISAQDQPLASNVVMPALVRSGQLQIGIATSGACPALARRLREQLETLFDDEFAAFVDLLAEARRWLMDAPMPASDRRARLRQDVEGLQVRGRIIYPEWFKSG